MSLTYYGHVHVYFNRHQDAPRVWCISDPARRWELQVASYVIDGPMFESVYAPPGDPDLGLTPEQPSAYQRSVDEVEVVVINDRAVIRHVPFAPDGKL